MNIKEFVSGFFQRKGHDIFLASLVDKAVRLLLVVWVTRVIPKSEVGLVVYAQTALAFIIPFLGFGIQQGLIRFGALSDSQSEKKALFKISLRKGLVFSALMMGLFIAASPWISSRMPGARIYLVLLSFQFVSLFVTETVKIYARLLNLNRLYARIEIFQSLALLVSVVLLSYWKGALGYAVALSFAPLPVALYYIRKFNLKNTPVESSLFELQKFLQYGLVVSLVNVLSQLLFAVDIILIGNLLPGSEELVAQYKISNIIPFSLLIIGTVFIRAEYVRLTFISKTDPAYVFRYYKNYFKVFFVIGIAMLLFFYFFSGELLWIFGKDYTGGGDLMFIFAMGVFGGLLFRVPMGNILTALGWVKLNALNSLLVLILNLGFSYWAILHWGITGAAVVTSSLMWISGLFSLAGVWYYVKSAESED